MSAEAPTVAARPDHLMWLERRDDDFPYYRGKPVEITGPQWWFVMLGVAAGYLVLIFTLAVFSTGLLQFLPAILFFAIPLVALGMVAGRGWSAIFRPLRGIDFVWMVVFFILNWVVVLAVGLLMINLLETSPNPATQVVATASTSDRIYFFVKTGLQLFGEEVFSILPFLALLYWLVARRGMSRNTGVLLACLGTALIFALAHLNTYNWNFAQALLGVGVARLVLLVPYIMTKNVLVSTGAHVLNDWAIFSLPLLLGAGSDG
ncbi:CPBP family glutamic-type intramembrane protease [Microbaculum sp. FT89]|uniref:CPBP family glutamic-type intramembrane protease n=1 Tax=Microbaculum sp. FT89 TaxID=3447298 RepID=UPI003F53C4E1